MTANVAQVFLTDEDWLANLRAIRAGTGVGLRPCQLFPSHLNLLAVVHHPASSYLQFLDRPP